MKQLLIIIFLLITSLTYAEPWSIKGEIYTIIPADSERIVQEGYGVQVSLKKDWWYVYLSTDVNGTRFSGQSGFDINIDSIGVGAEYNLMQSDKNKFSIFADIGYYIPRYEDTRETFPTTNSEGIWRYMNKHLSLGNRAILFKEYENNYDSGVGAKVGILFDHFWTASISSGIAFKYRFLKLDEQLIGYDDPITHNSWNLYSKRDFGGCQITVNLFNITF